ncbi:MAG: hypothetical protein P4M10_03040 [Verrucomicrobiae bacterium]|nr:hypothetical protein [Verrucomicrobiae bacterium]
MDFLKKHYEKVLLGVMLAGLIGGLVFMLFYIASDQQAMTDTRLTLTNPKVVQLTNLDMALFEGTIARAQAPYDFDLENTNKLFNPMEWQKTLDGQGLILKTTRTGPQVVVVTNIFPLYTVIWLDSVITNELGVRYDIKVERQAAPLKAKRKAVPHYVSKDDKPNADFALLEVKGAPENPDALVLKLADSGKTVTVTKDKPYEQVDAYAADFRYDPERKVFQGKRAGDKVPFGGGDYIVVEVNQNELILEDQSNHKKTSLPFVP